MENPEFSDVDLWNEISCGKGEKYKLIQLILASLVADGLSRYGSHQTFVLGPDPENWGSTPSYTYNHSRLFTELPHLEPPSTDAPSEWMEVFVNGYAYFPRSGSDRLALAVACLYMLLAASHVGAILFLPRHRITSSAWDTVTELLVLCQNSPPPTDGQLKNATVGIRRKHTYKTIVKVRARQPGTQSTDTGTGSDGTDYGGQVSLIIGGTTDDPAATSGKPTGSSVRSQCVDVAVVELAKHVPGANASVTSGMPQQTTAADGTLQQVKVDLSYG